MGLTPHCKDYVGKPVYVEPGYGYGWTRALPSQTSELIEVPRPFHLRVERFFSVNNEMLGGLGIILEPAHPLKGSLVSFSVRHQGQWDFTARIGHYNLSVGSTEKVMASGWIVVSGDPQLSGWGTIRDDAV